MSETPPRCERSFSFNKNMLQQVNQNFKFRQGVIKKIVMMLNYTTAQSNYEENKLIKY